MIPFNKPYLSGQELDFIQEAVSFGKISGDGMFTKKCHQFFEKKFGFKKVLLTTSCTDALEMAAILIDIKEGDEVIIPSYTFVSTANAFVLRGAKIVFADSEKNNPNIDAATIESLITSKTKAIVPVHYAGIACDMDRIMDIAAKYNLFVIEDAAQAIDAKYKDRYLGSIGHLAAFSFHETKNVISGEGGMLVINDPRFEKRAEIIREKGTNRSQFFRGEIDKYGWVDIGSSFLPSDIIAAFLYAQLLNLPKIQLQRIGLWHNYFNGLKSLAAQGLIGMQNIPEYASTNGHMFYFTCKNIDQRNKLLHYLKEKGIGAVFHYISLDSSSFFQKYKEERTMPNSDFFTNTLVRLPLFYELQQEQQQYIIETVLEFYQ